MTHWCRAESSNPFSLAGGPFRAIRSKDPSEVPGSPRAFATDATLDDQVFGAGDGFQAPPSD